MKRRINSLRIKNTSFVDISKTSQALSAKNLAMPISQYRCCQLGLSIALGIAATVTAFESCTLAQITPDATLGNESSIVTPNANVRGVPAELIQGGATRGVNLFHSFLEFNVGNGQRVYFANPTGIEAIFSRVTGNNLSNILGTLGVDGGASLFLLNPNGIIFGENARLDIAGSFVASTANSVVFENGTGFSATNPEAPPLLTINLTPGLQYGTNQPNATITNAGNLAVGQNLTLSAGNLDLQGQLVAGGELTLFAMDTVRVRDSVVSPFIASANGNLLIQGNQGVDIFALNHPNSGLFSGGNMVLRSANPVGGDAHYWSGGSFRIEQLDGNLGDLNSPYDPIIRSLGDVSFNAYQGTSLHILAGGEVNIGTVVITGAETGAEGVDFIRETVQLSNGNEIDIDGSLQPTLDIRAGVAPAFIGVPGVTGFNFFRDRFFGQGSLTDVPTSADITIGDVWIVPPNGLVFISNQYQPNTSLLSRDITLTAAGVFRYGIDARGIGGNGSSVILDSRGNIAINGDIASPSDVGNGGDITLIANESISQTDSIIGSISDVGNAGDITLLANETVSLSNSLILNLTIGSGEGGDINIQARQLQLTDGAQVSVTNRNEGKAGNLIVNTSESVEIIGINNTDGLFPYSSSLTAQTTGAGDGGNIEIRTPVLRVTDGAGINMTTFGTGKGGSLVVNASELVEVTGASADGQSRSTLDAQTLGTGDGGNIEINTPVLRVTDDALVNVNTRGEGNAGNVIVNASELVELIGGGLGAQTLGTGNGGNVEITTPVLMVTDGGVVSVSTTGEGKGGNVVVEADELVQVMGESADGLPSSLIAVTFNQGNGGDVEINTPVLMVMNGAIVSVGTLGEGKGGDLIVDAFELVQVTGTSANTGLSSRLDASTSGTGEGGNVKITTPWLLVTDGAQVSASTTGEGKAGSVIVDASELVQLRGTGGLLVNATAGGTAGDLFVNTNEISVTEGAQVTVSSPQGQAGNLNITANSLTLNQGTISAETSKSDASEGGANITLSNLEFLRMDNESLISASALETANGGNVTIDSTLIVATPPTGSEGSDIIANAEQGNGGQVNITTQGLFGIEFRPQRTPKNDITVSSTFGLSGEFTLNTPGVDPSRGLAELPINITDASELIDRRCTPGSDARQSSFTITGRGGLPPSPNNPLTNEEVQVDWATLEDSAENPPREPTNTQPTSSKPQQLVEAQGWMIDENGQVTLTAQAAKVTPQGTWLPPLECNPLANGD